MSAPKRIRMTRQRPWRSEHPDAVIVARPSKWGNRFKVGNSMCPGRLGQCPSVVIDQRLAVELYRVHVQQFAAEFGDYVHGALGGHDLNELRGRDLACWCPLDQPCHADVLLEIANGADS